MKFDAAIKKQQAQLVNRRGIVFHHYNARLRRYLTTRLKLLKLEWEVMAHHQYNPDLNTIRLSFMSGPTKCVNW